MTAADDEPVVLAAEATGASIEADVYADKPMARGDIHDIGADTPAAQAHRLLRMSLRDFRVVRGTHPC